MQTNQTTQAGERALTAQSFTKHQREELRERCDVRLDTVEGEPESGDEFENAAGALTALRLKLEEKADVEFIPEEREWMKCEAENLQDIANANHAYHEWDGERKSMRNLVGKF